MNRKTAQTIGKGLAAIVIGASLFAQSAIAGEDALLGIVNGFPKIDFTGTTGQGCNYDSTNDVLTITGTPGITFFAPLPTGPIGFISGGLVTINLNIDDSGTLNGGTFTLNGSVSDGSTTYSDPLLTGTLVGGDYGIVDLNPTLGATDVGDLRVVVDGGSMKPLWDAGPSDIGITLTLELSTYSGTMTADWGCGRAKGQIGTVPQVIAVGEGACSQGFWKNHVDQWPVTTLFLGSTSYSQMQLETFLALKTKGDKSLILAKQLIAAKLNIAGGSDPSCIAAQVQAADDWIDLYAPAGVGTGIKDWNGADDTKDDLDAYNNGGSCGAGDLGLGCTR